MSKPPIPDITLSPVGMIGAGDLMTASTTAADEGLSPAQSISQQFTVVDNGFVVTQVGFCVQGNYGAGAFTVLIDGPDSYGDAPPQGILSGSNTTDRTNAPYGGDVVVVSMDNPLELVNSISYTITVMGNANNGVYSAILLGMAPEVEIGMSLTPEVLWGTGQQSGGFPDVDDKKLKFALFNDLDMNPDPIPEGSIPVNWQVLGSPVAVNKFYGAGPPGLVAGAVVNDFYFDVATQTYYVAIPS